MVVYMSSNGPATSLVNQIIRVYFCSVSISMPILPKMANFGYSTSGAEVVEYFKERVKGKTSKTTITNSRTTLVIRKAVLITGPSDGGIGAETALSLAAGSPAYMLLAGRSLSKIQPVIDRISGLYPEVKTQFISLDLSSQLAIREAAASINESVQSIDILINNAAVMGCPFAKTANGIESQFGTNHIGHFLLTNLIMERLIACQGARIVNVSSSGHRISDVQLDDWNFQVCKFCYRVTVNDVFR